MNSETCICPICSQVHMKLANIRPPDPANYVGGQLSQQWQSDMNKWANQVFNTQDPRPALGSK